MPDDRDDDLGGDPACWLDQVCDACGALVESRPHDCPADQGDTTRPPPF